MRRKMKMKAKTATVVWGDGDDRVTIVVREATALMGLQRSIMISESFDEADDGEAITDKATTALPPAVVAERWLRRYTYPTCIAPVVSMAGMKRDLSFDEFTLLPDRLVERWVSAVLALNPHWKPFPEGEEEEKNAESAGGDNDVSIND